MNYAHKVQRPIATKVRLADDPALDLTLDFVH